MFHRDRRLVLEESDVMATLLVLVSLVAQLLVVLVVAVDLTRVILTHSAHRSALSSFGVSLF